MPAPSGGAEPAEEDGSPPYRDREPPPYYDREDPGRSFKPWLRELELWAYDTEVPKNKHGTRILRRLGGVAKAAANELETSEIIGEKGKENTVAKLTEYFAPHLETTMPKAFEKAVYGEGRGSKETLSEYIVRMDAAFRDLKNEGVDLPSEARGYVLFRQARLSTVQPGPREGSAGRWSSRPCASWTRSGPAKRGAYFDEGEDEDDEPEGGSDYDEDYVYMEQRTSRRCMRRPRSSKRSRHTSTSRITGSEERSGIEKPKGKGKGAGKKGDGRAGACIHISMLKLRTKCAKCGQVGHWAAECSNQPDGYRKSGGTTTSSQSPPVAGSASKTGFYQDSGADASNAFWGKKPLLGSFLRASRTESSIPRVGSDGPESCDSGVDE